MMPLIFSFLLVSVFKTCLCDDPVWCYDSQKAGIEGCRGPNEWCVVNVTCGGAKQSPIAIKASETEKPQPTKLKFTGYDVTRTMKMKNDKKTVTLTISPGATLTWGQLSRKYKAIRIDFHWGEGNENPGSEHTIDEKQYPMEMQVLHLKDKYTKIEEAEKDPTGVAILAFFFEAVSPPAEEAPASEQTYDKQSYKDLVEAVTKIIEPDAMEDLNIALNDLILTEEDMKDYYYYKGSLTKPGCQPAIWIVFKKALQLTQTQIDEFHKVKFDEANALVKNYRPVQPLHGRVVYAGGIPSSGAVLGVSFTFILMCLSAALGCYQLI
ncbi:carbonic anhydrase 4-like [Clarias gariepinus]|uniref:carbonic anhydrase 4-like n=1 Tax=Clarias gariepinus TaxID=13013 RepID=UPI00234C696C|nr:carbonic anhydrase 4-like [Clarias gariepinus]